MPDWGRDGGGAPSVSAVATRALLAFGLPLVVLAVVLAVLVPSLLVAGVIVLYLALVWWWVSSQGRRVLRLAGAEPPRGGGSARILNLVAGLSADLAIPAPEVLVADDERANALVCLAGGPKFVVTSSLLEGFTRTEQEAVVAHCLVRLRGGQVRWTQLSLALGPFGGALVAQVGGADDVAAASLTRYPPALAAAVRKAEAATGRYGALWFVGGGTSHVPAEQRAAALADL
ncbi:MAG: hypothetical protein ACRDKZ_10955 [Actinomycetota bacterium]